MGARVDERGVRVVRVVMKGVRVVVGLLWGLCLVLCGVVCIVLHERLSVFQLRVVCGAAWGELERCGE